MGGLQFTMPSFEGVNAGSPINITWSGATGTPTLTLQNGTENSINDVDIIASDIQGSFFVWTPPATIPSDDYILLLKDDSSEDIAYSNVFRLLAPGETLPVVTAVDPNLGAASTPEEDEEEQEKTLPPRPFSSQHQPCCQDRRSSRLNSPDPPGHRHRHLLQEKTQEPNGEAVDERELGSVFA